MDEFAQATADGVVLDLGVSSFQFDQPERGFSFRDDGPLDMRMSQSGESAADFVNTADEQHAGLDRSPASARRRTRAASPRAIIAARPDHHHRAAGRDRVARRKAPPPQRFAIHPATRTFQALRIHVNDELGELERGLDAALNVLGRQGRLVVVSFHSLEDRIVKRFLAERSTTRRAAVAPRAGDGARAQAALSPSHPRPRMPRRPRSSAIRARARPACAPAERWRPRRTS